MSRRKARIVILCEDIQHATFLRRVLYEYGWTYHDLEVKKCPEGKRDAKQYIRTEYPHEVTAFRSKKNKINLCLFIVDGPEPNLRPLARCLERPWFQGRGV